MCLCVSVFTYNTPEVRHRDIYLRHYTQMFQNRLGLNNGVHVSLAVVSSPQISSLESESESSTVCAASSAPLSADAC